MPKYIRKPFDLQKALAGASVVFADGDPVKELKQIGDHVVALAPSGSLCFYDTRGRNPRFVSLFIEEEVKDPPIEGGTRLTLACDGTPRIVVDLRRNSPYLNAFRSTNPSAPYTVLVINPANGGVGGFYEDLAALARDVGESRMYRRA